jgi:tetratricopeptide (TPR) repeat protein
LSLPDPAASVESIRQADAELLFVDRAQHQQPEFALTAALAPAVAQLCIRLDGIPFALELAAALVHAHSIDEINARLDDRFNLLLDGSRTALPRQQTLRATLDWSHGLLSEPERRVLQRASLFLGGFTLGAAAAVATDEMISESAVAGLLAQLVARSLVVAETNGGDTRYRMLETTRAYGREKLDAAGETEAMQRRHAQYFRDRFESSVDDWLRLPEAAWRALYLPEVDNVRAAIEWSLGTGGDAALAVGLAGASGPVWTTLSLYGEGAQWIEAAAARIQPETSKADQARLSFWLASVFEESAPARALAAFEHSIRLYQHLHDSLGLVHSKMRLARVLIKMGRFESAAAALADVHAVESAGLPRLLGVYFANMGYLKVTTGNPASARAHMERASLFFREAGMETAEHVMHGALADVTWALGDLAAAEASFREAIAMLRKSPASRKRTLGTALANLAGVLTERGNVVAALEAAREALPLLSGVGRAWRFMDHLALRAALAGKVVNAAQLVGFADSKTLTQRAAREPNEARARTRVHALLRERLDPAELEHLLAKGAKITDDEACQMALED